MSDAVAGDDQQQYYAHRATQERAAAERSDDPVARRVHLELARAYADRTGDADA